MSVISMLAPSAYQRFQVGSGNVYVASVNKVISSVAVGDAADLLNSGCIPLSEGTPVLNNDVATTDPTANDDTADGYGVGSRWVNVTAGTVYYCVDATAAAAVWSTPTAPTGGTLALGRTSTDAIGVWGKTAAARSAFNTAMSAISGSALTSLSANDAYGFATGAQGDALVAQLRAAVVTLKALGVWPAS